MNANELLRLPGVADGMIAPRLRLELAFERDVYQAFQTQLRAITPRTTADVDTILERLPDTVIRDTLRTHMLRSAMLGVTVGQKQVEVLLGTAPKDLGIDWSRAIGAIRRWATSAANTVSGLISHTTRDHVQIEVDEWRGNSLPLPALREGLETIFTRSRAGNVATTEVTGSYAQGLIEAYRESKLVEFLIWHTMGDERVCPICAPLGGMVFTEDATVVTPETEHSQAEQIANGARARLDGGFAHPGGAGMAGRFGGRIFTHPPAHVRCRCWIVPQFLLVPAAGPAPLLTLDDVLGKMDAIMRELKAA